MYDLIYMMKDESYQSGFRAYISSTCPTGLMQADYLILNCHTKYIYNLGSNLKSPCGP